MTEEKRPPKIRYVNVAEQEVHAFRELGQAVLGQGWVYRLAQFVGVSTRTAQRWAAGESTVPLGVLEVLRREQRRMGRHQFQRQLRALVDDMAHLGISPHVLSAHLRDEAARVKPEESTNKGSDA
jgi:hypothetical protein